MRTTIDSGGRIVVPKKMRDMLGLVAGSEVEIEFDGPSNSLLVAPVVAKTEIEEINGVWRVKSRGKKLDWSADELREFTHRVRDERL